MAVVDYFLKIEGVSGESLDSKHKGEIEIESFSWGATQTATHASGGGGGAGKVSFQDLHFTTPTNKASPVLFQKCATGEHLKKATLVCRKAGEKQEEFLKITLQDVLISSYRDAGTRPAPQPPVDVGSVEVIAAPSDSIGQIGGIIGPDTPTDNVSLRYAQVQYAIDSQTFNVPAAAMGQIRFDPKTGRAITFDAPGGVMTVGTVGGMTQRAVQEFDIANLIGLLTAPFSTAKLSLVVAQVQPPTPPPVEVNGTTVLSRTAPDTGPERLAGAAAAKPPKKRRYDVILYTPADGTVTVEDLTRHGRRIGTITVDPNAPLSALEIDLLRLLEKHHIDLGTFGIRLQLRGAHVHGHDDDDDHDDDENDDHDDDNEGDDEKPTSRPDVNASFTIDLVFVTA